MTTNLATRPMTAVGRSTGSSRTTRWLALAAVLGAAAGRSDARDVMVAAADVDRAAMAALSSRDGKPSKVVAHVDLTSPFRSRSQWTLVVGQQEESCSDGECDPGPVSICFVQRDHADCSETWILEKYKEDGITPFRDERPVYEFHTGAIVYAGPGKTRPLLLLKTCTMYGANGNCGVGTFLFDYDRSKDALRPVFANTTGRNNNQETRFIASGPLLGDVVVADPTMNAPFGYWMDVYQRRAGGDYARTLRYRSATRYNDGNRLAVIDAEMREIMRRMGVWKAGSALPKPARMPSECTRLLVRKGVVWCE